jgi:hypothetical protein
VQERKRALIYGNILVSPGGTEEDDKERQPVQPVSGLRFEPDHQLQSRSADHWAVAFGNSRNTDIFIMILNYHFVTIFNRILNTKKCRLIKICMHEGFRRIITYPYLSELNLEALHLTTFLILFYVGRCSEESYGRQEGLELNALNETAVLVHAQPYRPDNGGSKHL